MNLDLSFLSAIGPYTEKQETSKDQASHTSRTLYYRGDRPFLVLNHTTIELRCDRHLSHLLIEKYESVMQSRYFGRGGLEIIPAGQLTDSEIHDLIRLSYDLTSPDSPLS